MKRILFVSIVSISLLFAGKSYSQCSNFGSQFPSTTQSTTSPTLVTVSTAIYGSEWAAYSVSSGQTYTWTTCGDTDFDTQLTLWDAGHTASIAYSDDACGTQSTITWTATFTGTVHVLLSQFNCTSNTTAMTVQWACTSCSAGLPPTNQDCRGAIPLCFATYSNPNSYTGQGNYYNEIPDYSGANSTNNCPSNCLLDGELNDVWYTFTVQNSGTVSFTINPVSSGDDYDWAVYNVTNYSCSDILTNNAATQVSCNFCGLAGSTGPTGGDPQTCEYGDPAVCSRYNAALNVTAGQIYVVNVSNFSSTQSGYSITFGGTAQIVDNDSPDLQSITSSPACGQNQVGIRFNENIKCSTVQPSDFTITGTGGPYTCTQAYSSTCASGGNYDRNFLLTISPAFTAGGTYTISLVANSVEDICSKPTGSQTLNFTVTGVSGTAIVNTQVSCSGGTNGSATASGSGGTPPYSYLWSNGATSAAVSGLGAGTYTVTISDALALCKDIRTVTITQPSALSVTVARTNIACYGSSTGTATATPTGGTAGYSYLWSNGGTGATISGLAAATYTVTVTDTRGCVTTGSATVSQPTTITVTMAGTNISCFGGSNGTATATPSGGTPNYTYAWSNGGNAASISGLAANTYTVTVTDAAGCTKTNTQTITAPTVLNATVSPVNASCNGGTNGSLTANPSGGTPTYTYSWFPSGQTSQTATGLAAGSYTVTVTDTRGCTKTVVSSVGQPSAMTLTPSSTNATCGGSNGSATIGVSGGTSPYNYNWSNGGSTSTIGGIPSGSYGVTVTDNNSCTSTSSSNVSNSGAPSLSLSSSTMVNCFGGNNGAAAVTASGGTPTYTYLWSTGGTSTSVSGLISGTYSATVTDAMNCKATVSINITQPSQLITSIIGSVNPLCNGSANGNATVAASGGSPTYTYLWSNGQTTANAINLGAGTFGVTTTDSHSCTSVSSATLSQPSAVSAIIGSNVSVTCNGLANGSTSVNASGGTSPYTYIWSNGVSNSANTGLAAGTYTVTVRDNNSCTATTSVTIAQPANLVATIPNAGNVSCNAGTNGQAVSNVTGGTIPYNYNWSNSASTANITGLSAGTYTLTVSDQNSCTATANITITQPTAIVATTSINNNVSCPGGNNGSVSVTASGGTPIYFYNWSNGSSVATTGGLAAGSHSVTVTDANMCTSIGYIVISQPDPIVINISPDSVNCFGSATGTVSTNPLGGTSPYTFIWSNGNITQNINSLAIGTYNVTLTDAHNCTSTSSTTLYQPTNVTVTSVINDAHCGLSDGDITITPSGGTPGYTYLWDSQAGGATTPAITTLPSSTYYVTITDAQMCEYVNFFSISDIGAPAISFQNQVDNVCFEDSLGSVSANITGGIAPYTIAWSTGASVNQINNLAAGTYYITVNDNVGCATFTSVEITQPSEITLQVTSLDSISCFGLTDGAIGFSVTGGTPGFLYHWEDALGNTVGSTSSLINIGAGHYYLTITDANSCIQLFDGTFTEPNELIASIAEPTNPTCFGGVNGMAVASATGGTTPYSFIWDNSPASANDTASALTAGTYHVTISDANGCTDNSTISVGEPTQVIAVAGFINSTCSAANGEAFVGVSGGTPGYTFSWSNGSTNDTITGLSAGPYNVTVSDQNGCTATTTVTVGSQNAGTITVLQNTPVNCNGGADGLATVSMTGGTTPFTFMWSHDTGLNNQTANGLQAGDYSVTIIDANFCMTDTTITITEPTTSLQGSNVAQNISCYGLNNGIISLSVNGGTTPYTYLWTNSANTPTVSGLAVGGYSVTVFDNNNCQLLLTDIAITEPLETVTTSVITHPLCNGTPTGSVQLTVTGGTQPYTFNWSNGDTLQNADSLAGGIYTVTIVDNNGCTSPYIVTLINPLSVQVTADYGIDPEVNSGFITLTATGGQTPYTYHWSNGSELQNQINLGGGFYYLTLTDANTCAVIDSFYIDIPLVIPNMITPNADGVNDDFEVQNIEAYDEVSVEIYNRWGDNLFKFEGTGIEYKDPTKRWDGTFNGADLPMGSYVYIVNLKSEEKTYTGAISIKR